MLIYVAVIAGVIFFVALARTFRRTLGTAANPAFVIEKPPLPKGIAETVVQLERWRAEGRLGREDYEKLMHLCREDADAFSAKRKDQLR